MAPLTRTTFDQLDAPVGAGDRLAAFELFERLPLPSSADEAWRYVELDSDFTELDLPAAPGSELAPDPFSASLPSSDKVVLVDGHVVSSNGDLVAGALSREGLVDPATDKFAAAHYAFATGGASVTIPRSAGTESPVLIEVQASSNHSVSFPHLNISVGDNAEAQVVILYRSEDDLQATVNSHVEVTLGDGARLRLLTVQEFGTEVNAIIHQRVRLGRDAAFRLGEVGLGGSIARLDLGVDLVGQGASSEVVGLFFGHRQQILDYRMTITHVGRNTTSDVLLKGAVEDKSQSIFAGLVRIEKGAIRSSSFETNRNLVLSPDAKAHSIPNLEILCDDVMCGHGSSVGPLEEEHLYYLQSRGLSTPRAERLLVRGFFREVIDRLPVHGLDAEVARVLDRRFVGAQGDR
ncbi:MAG TPA: Fe-S cluster assembly protein SufD [Acidimicrobiia bacterium]|nr:Fe-S cluster assembly protein SufD [Acidimicrobiia bacterium]